MKKVLLVIALGAVCSSEAAAGQKLGRAARSAAALKRNMRYEQEVVNSQFQDLLGELKAVEFAIVNAKALNKLNHLEHHLQEKSDLLELMDTLLRNQGVRRTISVQSEDDL